MKLGISLYPDKTDLVQDQAYMELAYSLGFSHVFMSFLQLDIHDPKRSIQRIKESISCAKKIGMSVSLDIHPLVFQYIDGDEHDLHYFHDLGVTSIRLDSGYDGKTEAMMTHNPYGLQIEFNVSRNTHELERILDFQPNRNQMCGSHNFYPQRYTGLPLSTFVECSKRFLNHHIPIAAFITSQKASISPWPVSEGLCTLEDHRDVSLEVQFRHMQMMGLVDMVIIGNAYASEEELRHIAHYHQSSMPFLTIEMEKVSPIEETIVLCNQEYRGDASEYVIRSTKHRARFHKEALSARGEVRDLNVGDVVILNEEYGQYKGELQIILRPRKKDRRINIVGHVVPEELLLMKELRPFEAFTLKRKEVIK